MTKEQENVTYRNALSLAQTQGNRRVFQSGQTEETIRVPKARKGGEHEMGIIPIYR